MIAYPHNGISPWTGLVLPECVEEFINTASLDQMRLAVASYGAARERVSIMTDIGDTDREHMLAACDGALRVIRGLIGAIERWLRLCDKDGIDNMSAEDLAQYHRYKGTGKPKLHVN